MKSKLLNRFEVDRLPESLVKTINSYEQVLLYGIYGGAALLIDLSIYTYLTNVESVDGLIANTFSLFTGMTFSFALNSIYNFKTSDMIAARFASFVLVTIIGYSVSQTVLWVLIHNLESGPILAKICTLPAVFAIQYLLNKKFTFKEIKGEDNE